MITSVDVIRGSGDAQALGIRRINLDGNLARTSTDPPQKADKEQTDPGTAEGKCTLRFRRGAAVR